MADDDRTPEQAARDRAEDTGFLSPAGRAWLDARLIRSACCEAPAAGFPPRCSGCGLLVAVGSHKYRGVEDMPPWAWPGELFSRWRARGGGARWAAGMAGLRRLRDRAPFAFGFCLAAGTVMAAAITGWLTGSVIT